MTESIDLDKVVETVKEAVLKVVEEKLKQNDDRVGRVERLY